jgi:hypothetical protein
LNSDVTTTFAYLAFGDRIAGSGPDDFDEHALHRSRDPRAPRFIGDRAEIGRRIRLETVDAARDQRVAERFRECFGATRAPS